MGYGNLAKMAQQMQAEMARVQAEIAVLSLEGTAGGGAVTAVVNGNGEVVSLTINKDVVDPGRRRDAPGPRSPPRSTTAFTAIKAAADEKTQAQSPAGMGMPGHGLTS